MLIWSCAIIASMTASIASFGDQARHRPDRRLIMSISVICSACITFFMISCKIIISRLYVGIYLQMFSRYVLLLIQISALKIVTGFYNKVTRDSLVPRRINDVWRKWGGTLQCNQQHKSRAKNAINNPYRQLNNRYRPRSHDLRLN